MSRLPVFLFGFGVRLANRAGEYRTQANNPVQFAWTGLLFVHLKTAFSDQRPAAFFRSAALLVASQVKSASLRPKWPPLAVLR